MWIFKNLQNPWQLNISCLLFYISTQLHWNGHLVFNTIHKILDQQYTITRSYINWVSEMNPPSRSAGSSYMYDRLTDSRVLCTYIQGAPTLRTKVASLALPLADNA